MRDETFGPIIGIQKVSSDEEAIALMNDSEFGLTGSIWTKNTDGKAEELADQIEAGTVFINRFYRLLKWLTLDLIIPTRLWRGRESRILVVDAPCPNSDSNNSSDTVHETTSLYR